MSPLNDLVPQIPSLTLICHGEVCLLFPGDGDFSNCPNTESLSGSSDEEELLNILSSGPPPDTPATKSSSAAATDSSGSHSSGSQGRNSYW